MSKVNNGILGGIMILLAGQLSAQQKAPAPSDAASETGSNARHGSQTGSKNPATADIPAGARSTTDAGAGKLKSAVTGKAEPAGKDRAAAEASPEPALGMRDPFRPYSAQSRVKNIVRRRENLSPLERFEIAQLKLVGIVWQIKNPTALVEDSTGLGYVVKVGTPIGVNDGKIKVIRPDSVLIEEEFVDMQGAKRRREVSMTLNGD